MNIKKATDGVQAWCAGHNPSLPECPMMPSIRDLITAVRADERRRTMKILRTPPFTHVFGPGYLRSLRRRWAAR